MFLDARSPRKNVKFRIRHCSVARTNFMALWSWLVRSMTSMIPLALAASCPGRSGSSNDSTSTCSSHEAPVMKVMANPFLSVSDVSVTPNLVTDSSILRSTFSHMLNLSEHVSKLMSCYGTQSLTPQHGQCDQYGGRNPVVLYGMNSEHVRTQPELNKNHFMTSTDVSWRCSMRASVLLAGSKFMTRPWATSMTLECWISMCWVLSRKRHPWCLIHVQPHQ